MVYQSQIEKEAILELPRGQFSGSVDVITTKKQVKKAVKEMADHSMLGFDTESKPSFKKGQTNSLSLIQFASLEKAWIFRVNILGSVEQLSQIIGNPDIEKIGVATRDDKKSLLPFCSSPQVNFTDLQELVPQYGIEATSLKKLAAIVLGVRVSKSQQLSNWNAPELTEAQIRYAATDAWVALSIYQKLLKSNQA